MEKKAFTFRMYIVEQKVVCYEKEFKSVSSEAALRKLKKDYQDHGVYYQWDEKSQDDIFGIDNEEYCIVENGKESRLEIQM